MKNQGKMIKRRRPAGQVLPESDEPVKIIRVKPTDLYLSHFPTDRSEEKRRITLEPEVPMAVIGVLQAKLRGATTRKKNLERKIREQKMVLKTKMFQKFGRTIHLTAQECDKIRLEKVQAEAKLLNAKSDFTLYKGQLSDAMKDNSLPLKNKIKATRQETAIMKKAPSLARKVVESLTGDEAKSRDLVAVKEEDRVKFLRGAIEDFLSKFEPDLAGHTALKRRVLEHVLRALDQKKTASDAA